MNLYNEKKYGEFVITCCTELNANIVNAQDKGIIVPFNEVTHRRGECVFHPYGDCEINWNER